MSSQLEMPPAVPHGRRLLVCGGRSNTPGWQSAESAIFRGLLRLFQPIEVVHGGSAGIDLWGARIAMSEAIRVKEFLFASAAGKAGGPMRNKEQAQYVAHNGGGWVVAFDGGYGTDDMLSQASMFRNALTVIDLRGGVSL